jgi:hypothetical protein
MRRYWRPLAKTDGRRRNGETVTSLRDKLCVITGGAGSIGLATAQIFLNEGAKVVFVDRDADRLAEAAASRRAESASTLSILVRSTTISNMTSRLVCPRRWGATRLPSSTTLFRLDAMAGRWKLPKPFCILLRTGAASPPAVC